MPHKPNEVEVPEWVETLAGDDFCLYETVLEALVARRKATLFGADGSARCERLFRAADKTVEQIRYGRRDSRGRSPYKQAADALRKYTLALACVRPAVASSDPE